MEINSQCLNCGKVQKIQLSVLTTNNLNNFIGDFAKLKYCFTNKINCKKEEGV